ncbi:starch binding domain-containing protein [Mycena olivaceomarginata]|nr:starch binding domain-containing protein [Mycena olivaceomarginata]
MRQRHCSGKIPLPGWVSGSQANVFVTNHDTERNGNSLNINSPSNTYITATIFSLAHSYGTPTILSSYAYSTVDDGSGMVGFRNQVGTAAITNWVAPQSQQIAFGQGIYSALGFGAINNADSAWTFTTSLPNNAYCDVINGKSSRGACTGTGITVSGRKFTATVPARSAIAIHTGQLGTGSGTGTGGGTGSSTVAVSFAETATTTFGENIFLVGSISQLDEDTESLQLALSSAYPVWTITVNLPPSTTFEYKFIRKETDGSVVWESDPNRSATTIASGSQTISTSWK